MRTDAMRRIASFVLAAVTLAALSGCGPKRKPNLADATAGAGSSTDPDDRSGDRPSGTSLDQPDLNPVDPSGLSGADLPSGMDATTEGGPLEDIYFQFDQYELSEEAKAVLARHAAWLQARPAVKVMVEGHCDERGTVEYNLALGDKRARAARDYLAGLGVTEARLSAISLGKERPKDMGHDEAAWSRNRRAHFAVSR
jgi:peptidoglycan-associated lipoprotein